MNIRTISIRGTHNWDRYALLRLAMAVAPIASIAVAVAAAAAGHASPDYAGQWG